MDLIERGREDVAWTHVTRDRVQWQTLVDTGSMKGREFLAMMRGPQLLQNDSLYGVRSLF
jgi:hypothetical protein